MAGSATPTSSAGHATRGARTNPELTLAPDHSSGGHQWESKRNAYLHHFPGFSRHVTRGPELISELLNLFYNYGDRRLADAIDAIVDLGLIDEKGNWRRVNTGEGLTEAIEADVKSGRLTLTSAFLDQGYTLRIAAAKVAAEGEVAANSFDAAVKQITREWRSAGLQPGQYTFCQD